MRFEFLIPLNIELQLFSILHLQNFYFLLALVFSLKFKSLDSVNAPQKLVLSLANFLIVVSYVS